jgi:hypothetical protein
MRDGIGIQERFFPKRRWFRGVRLARSLERTTVCSRPFHRRPAFSAALTDFVVRAAARRRVTRLILFRYILEP